MPKTELHQKGGLKIQVLLRMFFSVFVKDHSDSDLWSPSMLIQIDIVENAVFFFFFAVFGETVDQS